MSSVNDIIADLIRLSPATCRTRRDALLVLFIDDGKRYAWQRGAPVACKPHEREFRSDDSLFGEGRLVSDIQAQPDLIPDMQPQAIYCASPRNACVASSSAPSSIRRFGLQPYCSVGHFAEWMADLESTGPSPEFHVQGCVLSTALH